MPSTRINLEVTEDLKNWMRRIGPLLLEQGINRLDIEYSDDDRDSLITDMHAFHQQVPLIDEPFNRQGLRSLMGRYLLELEELIQGMTDHPDFWLGYEGNLGTFSLFFNDAGLNYEHPPAPWIEHQSEQYVTTTIEHEVEIL